MTMDRGLLKTLRHELAEMIPPTFYFFIALHIVALLRELMNRNSGIELSTSMSVAIAALILGKAVVLANLLPFINRYPEKPLVWNTLWKTAIYFAMASVIHYLERLYDVWHVGRGFATANETLLAGIVWPHFWAVQILLAVLIFAYCATSELARVLGTGSLKKIFLGPVRIDGWTYPTSRLHRRAVAGRRERGPRANARASCP
jgi:hypothetical protein